MTVGVEGSAAVGERLKGFALPPLSDSANSHHTEERLPFSIRVAHGDEDISKAVRVRYAAYARHVPALAEKLRLPEEFDYRQGSAVLLAESRLDGSPLGTMRIETNRHRPLAVESSVQLPDWLQGTSLAEATRLGVSRGRIGLVVKTMLFKAFFLYCVANRIDWIVICARTPLDKQYDALLFSDVFPGRGFIPMRHGSNIPHRVLGFELASAEARWLAAKHPLYNLFCRTSHPDISVGSGGSTLRRNVRSQEATVRMEAGA